MDKVIDALIKADNLLNNLAVSGQNVFLLAEARKQMKFAFDELTKPKESEATNDGG